MISDIYNEGDSVPHSKWSLKQRLCSKLALDESQSLRTVLVDILLVRVGVVAVAAEWVSSVAVRLDDACTGGSTLEASRASGELWLEVSSNVC